MAKVRTNRYTRSHGKEPRGKGQWAFTSQEYGDVDHNDKTKVFKVNQPMTLSQAAKEAKAWAKENGHANIYVMESAKSKKLSEGVLDDHDDDGFMAKRHLYDIAKYAIFLHKIINDTDNLEPWVLEKITKASDYIDTVKHYLDYERMRNQGDKIDFGSGEDLDLDNDYDDHVSTSEDLYLESARNLMRKIIPLEKVAKFLRDDSLLEHEQKRQVSENNYTKHASYLVSMSKSDYDNGTKDTKYVKIDFMVPPNGVAEPLALRKQINDNPYIKKLQKQGYGNFEVIASWRDDLDSELKNAQRELANSENNLIPSYEQELKDKIKSLTRAKKIMSSNKILNDSADPGKALKSRKPETSNKLDSVVKKYLMSKGEFSESKMPKGAIQHKMKNAAMSDEKLQETLTSPKTVDAWVDREFNGDIKAALDYALETAAQEGLPSSRTKASKVSEDAASKFTKIPLSIYYELIAVEADTVGPYSPEEKIELANQLKNAKLSKTYSMVPLTDETKSYLVNSALPNLIDIANDKDDRRLKNRLLKFLNDLRSKIS